MKMSDFFLELFSEEIPSKLQINARNELEKSFKSFFEENEIKLKNINVLSTPNRLIVSIEKIPNQILIKSEEIRGPSTSAPNQALEGFLNSQNINQKKIYKKKTEKGEFYFYKKPSQKLKVFDILKKKLPQILQKISWKKSMKWGNYDLF